VRTEAPAIDTTLLRVISLGAGVQSTTMALMAARGEIAPMPDCAIFADTQGRLLSANRWIASLIRGV
jgi:hypothetical protein